MLSRWYNHPCTAEGPVITTEPSGQVCTVCCDVHSLSGRGRTCTAPLNSAKPVAHGPLCLSAVGTHFLRPPVLQVQLLIGPLSLSPYSSWDDKLAVTLFKSTSWYTGNTGVELVKGHSEETRRTGQRAGGAWRAGPYLTASASCKRGEQVTPNSQSGTVLHPRRVLVRNERRSCSGGHERTIGELGCS